MTKVKKIKLTGKNDASLIYADCSYEIKDGYFIISEIADNPNKQIAMSTSLVLGFEIDYY